MQSIKPGRSAQLWHPLGPLVRLHHCAVTTGEIKDVLLTPAASGAEAPAGEFIQGLGA
jgi:hypothetical protein